ncbi:ATP-binding protein [Dechloromonas hortensis]|uniref:ATP-binding protein n=1 Tax=Dechloromonas hortensis TaxID=337779 RepID=UPI001291685A|nr:ATP-binding protein [Dechloromonas hortensis]
MKRLSKHLRHLLLPDPSIRNKLILLSVSFLLVTVLLVFLLVYHQQKQLLQTQLAESMSAQARLLATNTQAAIAFLDRREADRLLSSLSVNPAVDVGYAVLTDGSVLAKFERDADLGLTIPPGNESTRFLDDHLVIRQPIHLTDQAQAAGRIELLVSLDQYHQSMRQTIGETLLLLFVALSILTLLTRMIVDRLTAPLEKLDGLVKRISSSARFDERVSINRADEIGRLGQGFNQMLDTLQTRDQELDTYRVSLEQMVDERTAALQEAIAEVRQANRGKSDFLARMSHEVRTPMNAITGLCRMVLETPLAPQQREHLEQVLQSSDALLGIINDILDYSKIEAGGLRLESMPFDIEQVFQSVGSLFAAQAQAQGLKLSFVGAGEVPRPLLGDALRLGQILINLVGNAVKFTSRGSVEVSVQVAKRLPEHGISLAFAVRDTGIGIPADQHEHLFAPFTQADSSITRRFGGTGLGLTICHQLVELMGGHISLESTPGQGSTFRFTISLKLADDSSKTTMPAVNGKKTANLPRWAGERILLVEDIAINRTIAIALLQRVGLNVGVASNGQEALDLLARETFSLVLMDIQMPVMDGLTATRLIRANPHLQALPVIAMTAHATSEDQEQTRQAGMNEHLVKPIVPQLLYAALSRWLPPCAGEEAAATESERPAGKLPDLVLPGIDQNHGLALHMHRPDLYLRSLHAFRQDFSDIGQRIREQLDTANTLEARRLAHSLKSVAGSLGAGALSEAARAVEQALAGEQPTSQMTPLVDRLNDEAASIRDGLAALPPLSSNPNCINKAKRDDLASIIGQLEQNLRDADAESEAQLDRLKAALAEAAPLHHELERTLARLGELIDDVEYEAALEKLHEMQRILKADKA